LKSWWQKLWNKEQAEQPSAKIIPRKQHAISRKQMSPNALRVMYRLHKAGFAAYLVGGGVRDLLLGASPKDFDVVTDAHPEEVYRLFRNSQLIGRRFRIVHVYYPGEIIEVSTFRATIEHEQTVADKHSQNNTFGSIDDDVWRRDFTVNALYYNIDDFSIVDYADGVRDVKRKLIRTIGDPAVRFEEDPVRMLRAMRLGAKLDFQIHKPASEIIHKQSKWLQKVPKARLFDEINKFFFAGFAFKTYEMLREYGYMRVLFPALSQALQGDQAMIYQQFIDKAMRNTDSRFYHGQTLNPGFLFSVLLWPAVQYELEVQQRHHEHFYQALHAAMDQAILQQNAVVTIPRRLTQMMRAIWLLQYHLCRRRGKRVFRTLNHRYFRAAIDFLSLRAEAGEPFAEEVQWWRDFRGANADVQKNMVAALMKHSKSKKHPKAKAREA